LLPTGEKFEVAVGSDYSKKVGYAAKVSYNQGIAKIYSTSKAENIYGTFNKDTKTIGTNKFSDNLKILEVDDYGNTISVFADRLDGVYLKKGEVALITKNSSREIENMIIKNVTGDMNKYGIVTSIKKSSNNASYNYVLDGKERTYSSNEYTFSIEKGPVQIIFDGQTITNKKNLKRVSGSVANINELYAENSSGDKYKISSDVVVYDMSGTTVMEATMEDAINSEGYVSAYYDKSEKDGGLIRVISIN
jgi:hypothetical protein